MAGPPAEEAAVPPAEVRPDRPRSADGERGRRGLPVPGGMARSRKYNTETLWVGKTLRYHAETEMSLLKVSALEPCGNGQSHKSHRKMVTYNTDVRRPPTATS